MEGEQQRSGTRESKKPAGYRKERSEEEEERARSYVTGIDMSLSFGLRDITTGHRGGVGGEGGISTLSGTGDMDVDDVVGTASDKPIDEMEPCRSRSLWL